MGAQRVRGHVVRANAAGRHGLRELTRGVRDLFAATVRQGERQGHLVVSLALDAKGVEDGPHERRQTAKVAYGVEPDAILEDLFSLPEKKLAKEKHEGIDFFFRASPVLLTERVERQRPQAQTAGGANRPTNRNGTLSMTAGAWLAANLRPPAVAIHDDADVPGEIPGFDEFHPRVPANTAIALGQSLPARAKRLCSRATLTDGLTDGLTSKVTSRDETEKASSSASFHAHDLDATFHAVRAAARARGAPPLEERLRLLERLEAALLEGKSAIADAIALDFGHRSKDETLIAEVVPVVLSIRHVRAHLADWMGAQPREANPIFFPSAAQVLLQPLGVVGIISPWNYPLVLALKPLVSALAAGNRALIKPSELTPRTADVLAEIISKATSRDNVAVITGGADVGEAFSRLAFDHLIFTGSARVGKLVMRAAAENLVPVTLELGGKCPAIVGLEANPSTAARRIMFGKTLNAGQTCVAPDYALVPVGAKGKFVEACRRAVAHLYPTFAANPDYTSMVDAAHFERVQGLVADAKEHGATVIELNASGESIDPATRKIPPTLLLEVTPNMRCMKEEIFGPVLPVVTYERLSEAIAHVNEGDRPLALYYFGRDEAAIDRVLSETSSGGVTINETLLHFAQDDLPIGGVGKSGLGQYQGRDGFEALSKKKAVFRQSPFSPTGLFKPPYGRAVRVLSRLLVGK
jgi:coniferyl-aldehyde dehydrogenase